MEKNAKRSWKHYPTRSLRVINTLEKQLAILIDVELPDVKQVTSVRTI